MYKLTEFLEVDCDAKLCLVPDLTLVDRARLININEKTNQYCVIVVSEQSFFVRYFPDMFLAEKFYLKMVKANRNYVLYACMRNSLIIGKYVPRINTLQLCEEEEE